MQGDIIVNVILAIVQLIAFPLIHKYRNYFRWAVQTLICAVVAGLGAGVSWHLLSRDSRPDASGQVSTAVFVGLLTMAAVWLLPVLLAWLSRRIAGRFSYAVMIDEPDGNASVLDRATYVFTYLGLKGAGWKIDKAQPPKYKLLIMRNQKGQRLRVRFYSKADVDKDLGNAIAAAKVTCLDPKLRRLVRRGLRYRFAPVIVVMGHSESTWTAAMGAVYASLGIAHVSPYATSKDLYLMVSKITQRVWKRTPRTALIVLPPCNDEQLHEILGAMRPVEGRKFMLWADAGNPSYAESFTIGLPRIFSLAPQGTVGNQDYELPGSGRLMIRTIGSTEDKSKLPTPVQCDLQNAVNCAKEQAVETIVLAGMYEFVKASISALEHCTSVSKIIVTDGFVSGTDPVNEDEQFRKKAAITVFTFPHPKPLGEATLPGLQKEKAKEVLAELQQLIWPPNELPKDSMLDIYARAFRDPNFGYYLYAGAYRVGISWPAVHNEAVDFRFWSVIRRARERMMHELFILPSKRKDKEVGFEVESPDHWKVISDKEDEFEVETPCFGKMIFKDKVGDALPWFAGFPGCSGYSRLNLIKCGDQYVWKPVNDA